jgi:hypothetical protein
MGFVRIVEVLPPFLSAEVDHADTMHRFVASTLGVRRSADIVVVAAVKDPGRVSVSSVFAAAELKRAGLDAAPTIVVRDSNRTHLLSEAAAATAGGFEHVMLVWGDDYPSNIGVTNVRDFPRLDRFIEEVRRIARSSGPSVLAPVDLRRLTNTDGVAVARARLKAGAELLLAQPPTVGGGRAVKRDVGLLESLALKEKVALGLFPFIEDDDVEKYGKYFGWELGEGELPPVKGVDPWVKQARDSVALMKEAGLAGVYLSTRGKPELAKMVLG